MSSRNIQVKGVGVDAQTRCQHYHSPVDIVAIKMKCCRDFYACKDCHQELAGHKIAVWARTEWDEPAVLCGNCDQVLTIQEYLLCDSRCPRCEAHFNPKCSNHHHFYFES